MNQVWHAKQTIALIFSEVVNKECHYNIKCTGKNQQIAWTVCLSVCLGNLVREFPLLQKIIENILFIETVSHFIIAPSRQISKTESVLTDFTRCSNVYFWVVKEVLCFTVSKFFFKRDKSNLVNICYVVSTKSKL